MPRLILDEVCWEIVTLHRRGYSYSRISRECHVSRHCVTTTIGRWIRGGRQDPTKRPAPRRKRSATNEQQDDDLIALSRDQPFLSPRELRARIGIEASLSTVKRRLRAAGLLGRRAPHKPSLTAAHRRERKDFCETHNPDPAVGGLPFDWNTVAFSDECIICTSDHGIRWVRRPRNARWEEKYIAEDTRGSRTSISVWGIVSSRGLGPLKKVEGRMNSEQYCRRIIQYTVKPYLRDNPDLIFQQDNATIHRSRYTTEYIQQNQIPVLAGWPAKSPDLSLIENVWNLLKRELEGKIHNLVGRDKKGQLYEKVSEAWTALQNRGADVVQNLYESMPRRIQWVIDKDGGPTPY